MCPTLAGTINVPCKPLPATVIMETRIDVDLPLRLKQPGLVTNTRKTTALQSCLDVLQTLYE